MRFSVAFVEMDKQEGHIVFGINAPVFQFVDRTTETSTVQYGAVRETRHSVLLLLFVLFRACPCDCALTTRNISIRT